MRERPPACTLDDVKDRRCPSSAPFDPADVVDDPSFGRIVRNELLVEFNATVSPDEAVAAIAQLPAIVLAFQPETNLYVIRLTSNSADLTAVWQRLRQDERVFAVTPHRVYQEF